MISVANDHFPPLPSDYVANHFSVLSYNLPLTADYSDFWKMARTCSGNIQADTKNGKHLEYLSVLAKHSQAIFNYRREQAKLKLANRFASSHNLSTALLHLELHPNNLFQLESFCAGSPSQGHMGTFWNFFSTLNAMSAMMTVHDGSVISDSVAEKYYNAIGATLDYIISCDMV